MRLDQCGLLPRNDDKKREKMKLQYKYQRRRPHRLQRTSIDIIAIILELVLGGVGNKYQIRNRASLEYNQLSSYLQMMIENDLLHMNGTKERLDAITYSIQQPRDLDFCNCTNSSTYN
jgi:predicted transcriptional regulator